MTTLALPEGFSAVDVASIEDRLTALWKAAAPSDGDLEAVHSCSLNLVACVSDVHAAGAVSEIVSAICAEHPIRALTIITDEAADPDKPAAWIKTTCSVNLHAQVCSEEIVLWAHPDASDSIVSAVSGVLVGGLPIYLWWRGGPPAGDPLFVALGRMADKIIVDSLLFGDGAAALDSVRRIAESSAGSGIADLNWERTSPWREAVAACFDDPALLALLPSLDRGSVLYAPDTQGQVRPSARALLVAGWLVSRDYQLRAHVRCAPDAESGPRAGRVMRVVLSSSRDRAQLALRRTDAPLGIEATAIGPDGVQLRRWMFAAKTLDEAELLHRCIDEPSRDPLLMLALRAAA